MSALGQWAFALCVAMVAMGLCKMLVPSKNMEKTFRFVVSVFFLCVLLSPAVVRFPALMIELPVHTQREIDQRSQQLDEMARQQALTMASGRLRQIISEKLSLRGINPHSIAINFNTNYQGETILESVEITLDVAYQDYQAALIEYLQVELGCSVWLSFIGEGG